jgi:hypothetical protein
VNLLFQPQLKTNQLRPQISFHTCTMIMDVLIDAHVINLLLQPGNLHDEPASAFDLWWHSQLLFAAGDYNRL